MRYFKLFALLLFTVSFFGLHLSNAVERSTIYNKTNKNKVKIKNAKKTTKKIEKKEIKRKQKENKKYKKDTYKKNKTLLNDNKKYPQCNGDIYCIKMQKVINEKDYKVDKNDDNDFDDENLQSKEDAHIIEQKDNKNNIKKQGVSNNDINKKNELKKNNIKIINKDIHERQYRQKMMKEMNHLQKDKNLVKNSNKSDRNNNKNNNKNVKKDSKKMEIKHSKISKKQKINMKKIKHMEFLDDSQIIALMDEHQKIVVYPKQINVRVRNKGVPNICLSNPSLKKTPSVVNNSNNKSVNDELKNVKENLKDHIEQSLIVNGVSEELIKYIISHLHYENQEPKKSTSKVANKGKYDKQISKKNTKIANRRKIIDFLDNNKINEGAKKGKLYKKKYFDALQDVEDIFLVDKNVILAIWSMETNYGSFIGNDNAFNALYSACMNSNTVDRLRYFENNIIALAILVDQGYFSRDVRSSFDGGLGGCQFMPDSFYKFAVSLSGGKADIIHNNEDVIASIGNYLHSIGWRYGEGILTEIELPKNINPCLLGMNTTKTVDEWKKLGIVAHKNKIGEHYMHNGFAKASIIVTDQNDGLFGENKRAFLVYDNYKVVLGYNQQIWYGLIAGLLFEKIGVEM